MKKTNMASPFADPRTGQLYFRRAVPEALRPAFDGKAVVKVSLRTKDPAEAKIGFARENAEFETKLAEARRRFAEGTLVPTPGAVVRRWCEEPATGTGLSGQQRLIMTFMELDAAAGSRKSIGVDDVYPPAIMGPPSNTVWDLVCKDKNRFEGFPHRCRERIAPCPSPPASRSTRTPSPSARLLRSRSAWALSRRYSPTHSINAGLP
ncbi:DUF6538 domain-containing protein [Sphingomonas sp. OK281]|uniref:DUF6538 domain-containing protein n=1 Tax=Sphingomonas sp. OK281 TaxID=1881067 RepID=UPI0020C88A94|nr:DUF6538 domain-containing protein [Sphingomonas sp. OK281]